jgi:hypothetical protein
MKNIRGLKKGKLFAYEGKADFPLFGSEIEVFIAEAGAVEYAEKCMEKLHSLPPAVIEKLCESSIAYCEDFRVYFKDENIPIPENVKSMEILKEMRPLSMTIDPPQ